MRMSTPGWLRTRILRVWEFGLAGAGVLVGLRSVVMISWTMVVKFEMD
jgi:hypothetical protein